MFEELRTASCKVVPVSTLTILSVSLALVSIITCLAAEKIESSLFGFMLAKIRDR